MVAKGTLLDGLPEGPEGQVTVSANNYYGFEGGWRRLPTFGYEPQRAKAVRLACERRDWRLLNRMRIKWYDEFDHTWHPFSAHFWDDV